MKDLGIRHPLRPRPGRTLLLSVRYGPAGGGGDGQPRALRLSVAKKSAVIELGNPMSTRRRCVNHNKLLNLYP